MHVDQAAADYNASSTELLLHTVTDPGPHVFKCAPGVGWSHFAQFTIAVVNKDPKKSKYSGMLFASPHIAMIDASDTVAVCLVSEYAYR